MQFRVPRSNAKLKSLFLFLVFGGLSAVISTGTESTHDLSDRKARQVHCAMEMIKVE